MAGWDLTVAVALRKESVDRNNNLVLCKPDYLKVALRKESVDRNMPFSMDATSALGSLSARRAWIEIAVGRSANNQQYVALRKESVDRNWKSYRLAPVMLRRSPQGERG